jgi:hypothetical protein
MGLGLGIGRGGAEGGQIAVRQVADGVADEGSARGEGGLQYTLITITIAPREKLREGRSAERRRHTPIPANSQSITALIVPSESARIFPK